MNPRLNLLWPTAAALLTLSFAPSLAEAQVNLPYAENFDAEATCGTGCGTACVLTGGFFNETVGDGIDWTVDANGTGSGNTGPAGDHTTGNGNYLYIEASTPCNPAITANLSSPVLNLSGLNPGARFWYHMFGGDMGELHIDLVVDPLGAATLVPDIIPAIVGNQGNQWLESPIIDLTAYTGQQVQVVFRGITGAGFTSDMAIDDFEARNYFANDVGVVSISTSNAACGGLVDVTIDVQNFGIAAQTGFDVSFDVDGVPVATETFTGTLNPGEIASFTFAAQANLAGAGLYAIDARTLLATDQEPANDAGTVAAAVKRTIATYPELEDFEGPTGLSDWDVAGNITSWELATPAFNVINAPYSGSFAWVTNATGNYSANENGTVTGPCYDMSGLSNPALEVQVWWESEFSWDGARVETSTDGGASWEVLGTNGDPGNWYTDGTINGLPTPQVGWTGRNGTGNTGGSNGWVLAQHDLPADAAGAQNVQLRVRFGSDGSVSDEGFAFDDVRVFNNPPRLEVANFDAPVSASALLPGQTNAVIQGLVFEAFATPIQDVNSVTLTKQGNLPDADIVAVNLWLDDGDGIFDPLVDVALDMPQTFTNGLATFNTAAGLSGLTAFNPAVTWVTYDIAANPTGGTFVGSGVMSPIDVTLAGTDPVVIDEPVLSVEFAVFFNIDILPFFDSFDAATANRLGGGLAGLTYPTATTAGSNVGVSAPTTADALVGLVTRAGSVTASSAPYMAAITFPNGPATGALDYYFDLSSYDATQDDVWLVFNWNNTNQTEHDEDNVFISLDNGANWAASVYNFDFTNPVPSAWATQYVNLSGWVSSLGQNFNNQVVVRFQAAGAGGLGQEGILIDDAWVGHPQQFRIERVPGLAIPSGGIDDVGTVPAVINLIADYTVYNDGDRELLVDSVSLLGVNNAALNDVTAVGPNPLPPGETATISVDFTVITDGAFNVDLDVQSNDPRLLNGSHPFSIMGVGIIQPDISVERPAGNPLASGSTDSYGDVLVADSSTATYTVRNLGGGALTISDVSIQNVVNATVSVAGYDAAVGPGGIGALALGYAAAAPGAFSWDIVITSDDPDTGVYTISVSGNGVDPEIELSRAGTAIANGGTDDVGNVDITLGTSTITYTIGNLGTADLILTSSVSIANASNANASVSVQPPIAVNPGGAEDFLVAVSFPAEGAFSFDVVVNSTDRDEPTYTVTVSGTAITPTPAIELSRGGNAVANGGTDAQGSVVPTVAQNLTYTVTNAGTGPLTVTGVAVSAESNVVATAGSLTGTIAPQASDTFTMDYTVAADGAFSFDVTVNSDDPVDGTYTFTVSGTGESLVPEIDISYNGSGVASGGQVDLGTVSGSSDLVFTIDNRGNADLNLTGSPLVSLGGASNVTASVEEQPALNPIPAGQSTTFTVRATPDAAGAFSVTASVESDDSNESPYDITIVGQLADVGPDSGTPDTGTGTDGGIADSGTPPDDDGGCGCSTTEPEGKSTAWHLLWLAALPFVLRRRRR